MEAVGRPGVDGTASVSGATAIYVYGFVALPAAAPALSELDDAPDVFLIAHGDVACAASVVHASDYERPPLANAAEQLAWVTPRAWRHHEVLRRLHASSTVVPLKFGTLCAGVAEAEALLARMYGAVRALLAHFDGKNEWTLKIALDRKALAAELQMTHPDLLALATEEQQLPEGRAYFARKRRERLAAELLASRIADLELGIYERIAAGRVEIAIPQRPRESAGVDADTVSRTPLLVDEHAFGELEARLTSLEAEHASWHLRFELSGPLPPYSFANALAVAGGPIN